MARKVNYILDLKTTNLVPKHRVTSSISIFPFNAFFSYKKTHTTKKNLKFDKS